MLHTSHLQLFTDKYLYNIYTQLTAVYTGTGSLIEVSLWVFLYQVVLHSAGNDQEWGHVVYNIHYILCNIGIIYIYIVGLRKWLLQVLIISIINDRRRCLCTTQSLRYLVFRVQLLLHILYLYKRTILRVRIRFLKERGSHARCVYPTQDTPLNGYQTW